MTFQYEDERMSTGMTALAGLAAYIELGNAAGLCRWIERYVRLRQGGQGWNDSQMVTSLVLLNLAGGQAVDDLTPTKSGWRRMRDCAGCYGRPRLMGYAARSGGRW